MLFIVIMFYNFIFFLPFLFFFFNRTDNESMYHVILIFMHHSTILSFILAIYPTKPSLSLTPTVRCFPCTTNSKFFPIATHSIAFIVNIFMSPKALPLNLHDINQLTNLYQFLSQSHDQHITCWFFSVLRIHVVFSLFQKSGHISHLIGYFL